jgi:hypothetical protein
MENWIDIDISDLGLTKEKALELVNRMNANWHGKYRLIWHNKSCYNYGLNPLLDQIKYYGQVNDNRQ